MDCAAFTQQASPGLQPQPLWIIPTAAVSSHVFGSQAVPLTNLPLRDMASNCTLVSHHSQLQQSLWRIPAAVVSEHLSGRQAHAYASSNYSSMSLASVLALTEHCTVRRCLSWRFRCLFHLRFAVIPLSFTCFH